MNLFNNITLNDGREIIGVIDYITKTHVYFFDTSTPLSNKSDFITLCTLWKSNTENIRFSVFCTIYYPKIILPKVTIISIRNIKNCDIPLIITPKIKQKKAKIQKIT